MGKPTFSSEQFLAAIPKSGGLFSSIAKKVGCDWHTAKKRIMESPTLKKAWEAECEMVLDVAENELIKLIMAGDLGAIKFYLSTKGKVRGFTQTTEVTGANGGPFVINLSWGDDEVDE